MSLGDRSDLELAEALKYESTKYLWLSKCIGLNFAFFSYHIMRLKTHWYIAGPLSWGIYLVARNMAMRNTIDRIYYPGEMVYKRFRGTDSTVEQDPEEQSNIEMDDYAPTEEDKMKSEILKQRNHQEQVEKAIVAHFEENKHKEKEKLEKMIYQIHGKWVNETDFTDHSHEYIEKQTKNDEKLKELVYETIDKKEESEAQYNKFIDLYIKLNYEPIVEDYEEMRYFTRNHDEKLFKILKAKVGNSKENGITSIEMN